MDVDFSLPKSVLMTSITQFGKFTTVSKTLGKLAGVSGVWTNPASSNSNFGKKLLKSNFFFGRC